MSSEINESIPLGTLLQSGLPTPSTPNTQMPTTTATQQHTAAIALPILSATQAASLAGESNTPQSLTVRQGSTTDKSLPKTPNDLCHKIRLFLYITFPNDKEQLQKINSLLAELERRWLSGYCADKQKRNIFKTLSSFADKIDRGQVTSNEIPVFSKELKKLHNIEIIDDQIASISRTLPLFLQDHYKAFLSEFKTKFDTQVIDAQPINDQALDVQVERSEQCLIILSQLPQLIQTSDFPGIKTQAEKLFSLVNLDIKEAEDLYNKFRLLPTEEKVDKTNDTPLDSSLDAVSPLFMDDPIIETEWKEVRLGITRRWCAAATAKERAILFNKVSSLVAAFFGADPTGAGPSLLLADLRREATQAASITGQPTPLQRSATLDPRPTLPSQKATGMRTSVTEPVTIDGCCDRLLFLLENSTVEIQFVEGLVTAIRERALGVITGEEKNILFQALSSLVNQLLQGKLENDVLSSRLAELAYEPLDRPMPTSSSIQQSLQPRFIESDVQRNGTIDDLRMTIVRTLPLPLKQSYEIFLDEFLFNFYRQVIYAKPVDDQDRSRRTESIQQCSATLQQMLDLIKVSNFSKLKQTTATLLSLICLPERSVKNFSCIPTTLPSKLETITSHPVAQATPTPTARVASLTEQPTPLSDPKPAAPRRQRVFGNSPKQARDILLIEILHRLPLSLRAHYRMFLIAFMNKFNLQVVDGEPVDNQGQPNKSSRIELCALALQRMLQQIKDQEFFRAKHYTRQLLSSINLNEAEEQDFNTKFSILPTKEDTGVRLPYLDEKALGPFKEQIEDLNKNYPYFYSRDTVFPYLIEYYGLIDSKNRLILEKHVSELAVTCANYTKMKDSESDEEKALAEDLERQWSWFLEYWKFQDTLSSAF